jgi:hypothetical protein
MVHCLISKKGSLVLLHTQVLSGIVQEGWMVLVGVEVIDWVKTKEGVICEPGGVKVGARVTVILRVDVLTGVRVKRARGVPVEKAVNAGVGVDGTPLHPIKARNIADRMMGLIRSFSKHNIDFLFIVIGLSRGLSKMDGLALLERFKRLNPMPQGDA